MNNYSAKDTNAELQDVSWSNIYTHINEEGKKLLIESKPSDSVMNLSMWLLDQLAKHNEEVLAAVDDDWNFIVDKKTITVFNPEYGPEADRLDKHKKVLIHFWDLVEHTRGRGMRLRLMNDEKGFFYSAIFFMYKLEFKKYRKSKRSK